MALSSFSFAVRGIGCTSSGAGMFRRDLSTFREEEVARLAARERIEFEAEVGYRRWVWSIGGSKEVEGR